MSLKMKRFIGKARSCSCSMTGVWRAVTYCDGVVAVFHSPRACAHIARTMDVNSCYSNLAEGRDGSHKPVPLISDQLGERESIFGGVERLQQCLSYAVKNYHPECIVIANSCVSGVIGDDVESAAAETEKQYCIPVVTVSTFGFLDGEYYDGYIETATKLMRRFFRPCRKERDTVLLLGDSGGPWGSYAKEVERLLEKMGIRIIGQFPGFMPFHEWPRLSRAEAVVVLGGNRKPMDGLQEMAAFLHETYQMGTVPGLYPIGTAQTMRWIAAVGRLFHREKAAEALIAEEQDRLDEAVIRYLPVTRGKRAALCIGRWLRYFRPDSIWEIVRQLQLRIPAVILLDGYTPAEREKMEKAVRTCTGLPIVDQKSGAELVRSAEVVLTTHELQGEDLHQIFLPMLPQAGTTAAIAMMEAVYRALCSRQKHGGMRYV